LRRIGHALDCDVRSSVLIIMMTTRVLRGTRGMRPTLTATRETEKSILFITPLHK
jgi:hypothetical protein